MHVKQQLEEKEQGDGPGAACAAQTGSASPLGARAAGGERGGCGRHSPTVDQSRPGYVGWGGAKSEEGDTDVEDMAPPPDAGNLGLCLCYWITL